MIGRFAMSARVTTAVNVRGERVGQRLALTWTIAPSRCRASVCQLLRLERELSRGRVARLTLHRVGRGTYLGRSAFDVALSCLGRIYRHGSRAPYEITLTVRGASTVDGVRFARRITASYSNPTRFDTTPCPLGPSHDAARYTGRASLPVPSPPSVSFSAAFGQASDTASFTDTSRPGTGGAPIIGRHWNFGDPGSGTQDTTTTQSPSHTFSAPGTHAVTLTVADANGLTSATTQEVVVP